MDLATPFVGETRLRLWNLDWSPDGQWLATEDQAVPDQPPSRIVLISPKTGEKKMLRLLFVE